MRKSAQGYQPRRRRCRCPSAPAETSEEACAAAETGAACCAAIEPLPLRCRETVLLHILDDLLQAEVAKRAGISRSMVEKHIVRGMLACRQCTDRLGLPPARGDADA